ncbi:hypothetical protein [Streptomyces sp. NPDC002078]
MRGETGTDGRRGPGGARQVPPNGYGTEPGQAAPPDAGPAQATAQLPGAGHAPSVSPNVYLPRAVSAPAYDGYADPAAAHGWTSAYDETRELPPLAEPTGAVEPAGPAAVTEPPGRSRPGEGRAARRRAERRTGGRRRVVAVAGALGVAGAVAVIAAMAGGSDSPASDGPAGGKPSVVGDSATASPSADAGSSAGATPTAGDNSVPASRSSHAPAAGASQGKASTGPATSAPATAFATSGASEPPATTADPAPSTSGFPDGRGHGHGNTKRPH